MIAHALGLPLEEALPQLGPLAVGALVALRLVPTQVRSWGFRRSAVGALVLALLASLIWSAAAAAKPGGATISASFSDGCRDLSVRSSEKIQVVKLRYADGRLVVDETVEGPDYAVDGAAGDELDAAFVKSGTARQTFTCRRTDSPPTAVLEIETPSATDCRYFPYPELPTCLAHDPRTVWSRPPEGELAFIFVSPFPPQNLSFSFRGTGSSDADGDLASWSIAFGDGTSASGSWSTAPPVEVVHAYASPFYGPSFTTVTLTVTDASGRSDSDTIALIGIDGSPD